MPPYILAPEPTPPVQQTISSWEDEFEPSDVATTVVEATLAEVREFSRKKKCFLQFSCLL